MRNQKGFTLIELIIVIVVLGILAVTAAPQFINFSGDARESAVKGLRGNIQGAYQTVYARAAVDGDLDGTTETPVLVNNIETAAGYPVGVKGASGNEAITTDGIIKAATLSDDDWDWGVSQTSATDTIVIAPQGYSVDDNAPTGDNINCYVTYKQTNSPNTPPSVTTVLTGCGN